MTDPSPTLSSFFTRWKQKTGLDLATLATQVGVRRQFIYELRDGHARCANGNGTRIPADQDERYLKLHTFFESHGMPGFLDAARKAQGNVQLQGTPSSRRMNLLDMILHLWRTFRNDQASIDETAWLTLLRYEKELDDDDREDVLAKTVTLPEESTRTDTLLALWKLLPRNAPSEVKTAYLALLDDAKELDEAEDGG